MEHVRRRHFSTHLGNGDGVGQHHDISLSGDGTQRRGRWRGVNSQCNGDTSRADDDDCCADHDDCCADHDDCCADYDDDNDCRADDDCCADHHDDHHDCRDDHDDDHNNCRNDDNNNRASGAVTRVESIPTTHYITFCGTTPSGEHIC